MLIHCAGRFPIYVHPSFYRSFWWTLEPELNVTAVQETHFICAADCQVLEGVFDVFSAFACRSSTGVSLLVRRSLDADVNVGFAGDEDQLLEPMFLCKASSFMWLRFMRPISQWIGILFFRRLVPFLDDLKWPDLMGNWNTILYPKIDKVGRENSRLGRCESSLIDLMVWLTGFEFPTRTEC